MAREPYYATNPDPSGEPETFDVTMDALNVARLSREPETGDWVISARQPLDFADVSIPGGYDETRARSSAAGWVEQYVSSERRDLLEDGGHEITRRGGVLPMGEGRVGIPLEGGAPSAEWMAAFREAFRAARPDDEVCAHAADTVTADEANGVSVLVFVTSGQDAASFAMSYLTAFDEAIAAASHAD